MRKIFAVLAGSLLLWSCGSGGVELNRDDDALDAVLQDFQPDRTAAEVLPDLPEPDRAEFDLSEILQDDAQDGLAVEPGDPGTPCVEDADCLSGYCIVTPDGKQCTMTCDEECPFGWECTLYTPSLPDEVFLCLPRFTSLCRPCLTNADCMSLGGDTGQACIPYGPAGSFCAEACGQAIACPPGYACQMQEDVTGESAEMCVLTEGECACSQWFIDAGAATDCFVENEFGLCTGNRMCTAAGLSACSAPVPSAETCNGVDDDCDGTVDEETGGAECLVPSPYGNCPGTEICVDGSLLCEGPEAKVEQCDGEDNDCDGEVDETFPDTDNDGIADCLESDKDGDGIADGQDNCPAVFNPGQDDYDLDNDGDLCDQDDDNDMVADGEDCAPLNEAIHPGAEELCDGLDNDCNYMVDEGFVDTDADGWKDCVDDNDDNDPVPDATDCAPLDPAQYPGADEVCDGQDNNCNDQVDEGYPDADDDGIADCVDEDGDGDGHADLADNCPTTPNPGQEDLDGDGLGDACDLDADGDSIPDGQDNCPGLKNTTQGDVDGDGLGDACDADIDGDGALNDEDNCPLLPNPGQQDTDGDGTGDACEDDADGDGTANELDCAPLDAAIHPGADELCDGIDNDCDGQADEGFADADLDGLKDCVDPDDDNDGDPDESDCAPLDGQTHAGATEVCDGEDNNCDGQTDEGLGELSCGKGECFHSLPACVAGIPQTCDPFEGIAEELCDNLDNDCDGLTDEDQGTTTCGLGACLHTIQNCIGGQAQACDAMAGAGPESCDGLDNDCDGQTDEELGTTTCGLGQCEHTIPNCIGGVPQQCDALAGAKPESCDGLDNDCDGATDEGLGETTCGLGECEHTVANCVAGVPNICNPFTGANPEICDNLDNDCDGLIDEDLGTTTCGLGECQHVVPNCEEGAPGVCNPLAGATPEACDNLDNDCDGLVDEELGQTTCGLGECEHTVANCLGGVAQPCDALAGAEDELCDGLDNDCDGDTDEGFADLDGDDLADCIDDDADGDGFTVGGGDCDDQDAAVNPQADEICFNGTDDDCSEATPDACALASCAALLAAAPGLPSGTYNIDPDLAGPQPALSVYCDMEFLGGGWLAVYNQPQGSKSPAEMFSAISQTGNMLMPATPESESGAIATDNIPLADYSEVVYGWAPAGETVTRYGYYMTNSLVGECYVDGYCGAGVTIATFNIQPQNIYKDLQTGNSPTYPHVGMGWTGQQILWGYDNNTGTCGHWANFNVTTCCLAGCTDEMQTPGWRYVIYIR